MPVSKTCPICNEPTWRHTVGGLQQHLLLVADMYEDAIAGEESRAEVGEYWWLFDSSRDLMYIAVIRREEGHDHAYMIGHRSPLMLDMRELHLVKPVEGP